ncbi:hypothetical protein [Couchioplanes caeruleus]|nr:hypothetical protein [Couchioplanes caeruleus]
MYELVDLTTWARQVAATLSGTTPEGVLPWPVFAGEHRTWY